MQLYNEITKIYTGWSNKNKQLLSYH